MYVYGNCLELVYLKCLIIICMKGCYDAIFMLSIGVLPGGDKGMPPLLTNFPFSSWGVNGYYNIFLVLDDNQSSRRFNG